MVLTVVRSPAGFHLAGVVPKGAKFWGAYDLPHIMDPLLTVIQPDQQHPFGKLVVYADNACVDSSRTGDENVDSHRLQRADHPPYSPDLIPSDFFLFRFIKGQLKGTHFPGGQVLTCEVRLILSELSRSTVHALMHRPEQCATIGGDYVED
jgi:hypothetical protein